MDGNMTRFRSWSRWRLAVLVGAGLQCGVCVLLLALQGPSLASLREEGVTVLAGSTILLLALTAAPFLVVAIASSRVALIGGTVALMAFTSTWQAMVFASDSSTAGLGFPVGAVIAVGIAVAFLFVDVHVRSG